MSMPLISQGQYRTKLPHFVMSNGSQLKRWTLTAFVLLDLLYQHFIRLLNLTVSEFSENVCLNRISLSKSAYDLLTPRI